MYYLSEVFLKILNVAALGYKDHANVAKMKEFIAFSKANGSICNDYLLPKICTFIKENSSEKELLLFVI